MARNLFLLCANDLASMDLRSKSYMLAIRRPPLICFTGKLATGPTCRSAWRLEYLRGLCQQETSCVDGGFDLAGPLSELEDIDRAADGWLAASTDHIAPLERQLSRRGS